MYIYHILLFYSMLIYSKLLNLVLGDSLQFSKDIQRYKWETNQQMVQNNMLTKSLSRSDYNKQKKVAAPKTLQRVISQIPVRLHLLEPTESIVGSIKKYIQSEKSRDIQQISYLDIEPSLHNLQVRTQDLNRLLASRDDEITGLKNDKQKNEKKIEMLDKNVYDIRIQLQKNEYEYKMAIELLKAQNSTQKNEYLQRIVFLEDESKKFKECYDNLLTNAKEIYDLRIKSFSEAKNSYRLACEDIMKGLKKDINFQVGRNNQLKSEIFMSEKERMDRLRHLEQENYKLSQKIQEKQLEHKLLMFTSNSENDASSTVINELTSRIEEMIKTLQSQRQNFRHEKECMDKVKSSKEAKLRQNMENLLTDKRKAEAEFNQLQIKLNEVKYENQLLDNKCMELSTKIELLNINKKQSQQYLEQSIQHLKKQHQVQSQNELIAIKNTYDQQISQLDKDLNQKNQELLCLNQQILNLNRQIEDKNIQIITLEQKDLISKKQRQQLNQKYQILQKQYKQVKKQTEILQLQSQKQKEQLENEILKQKQAQLQEITNKSQQANANLKQQIKQIKITHDQENKSLHQTIEQLNQQIESLNQQIKKEKDQLPKQSKEDPLQKCDEKDFLEKIPESVSDFYDKQTEEQKQFVEGLRKTIQEQADILIRNSSTIQKLQLQNYRIKGEKVQREKVIYQLEKQRRRLQDEYEKLKDENIKKFQELKQKSQQINTKLQSENNKTSAKLQKAFGQIQNLQKKLNHLKLTLLSLQDQNHILRVENIKIMQALNLKEQKSIEFLNQLIRETKQNTETVIQVIKVQNQKLQNQNEKFMQEICELKQQIKKQNHRLLETDEMMMKMGELIQKKISQIDDYSHQVESKTNQINLLYQRINEYQIFIGSFEQQRKNLESERLDLRQKLSSYQIYAFKLRKLRIYDVREVETILKQNKALRVAVENYKMENEYQAKQKEKLKVQLNIAQLQAVALKIKLQQTSNPYLEEGVLKQKIKEIVAQKYEEGYRNLVEQIECLNEQLRKKEKELQTAKDSVKEYQLNDVFNSRKIADLQNRIKTCEIKNQEQDSEEKRFNNIIENKVLLLDNLRALSPACQKRETSPKVDQRKTQNRLQFHSNKINVTHRAQGRRMEERSPHEISSVTRQSPPDRRVSPTIPRELSPREMIEQFKAKVKRSQQIREEIISRLSQKHKQTVRNVQERRKSQFIPTLTGCMDQIYKLLEQIELLNGQHTRLATIVTTYMTQDESRTRKFTRIMDEWRQSATSLLSFQKELKIKDEKWKTVKLLAQCEDTKLPTFPHSEIKIEEFNDQSQMQQNKSIDETEIRVIDFDCEESKNNSKIKIIDYQQQEEMEEIAQSHFQDSHMMEAPFFPKTFPSQSPFSKLELLVASFMDYSEGTVKKQNTQDLSQTVQKQITMKKPSAQQKNKNKQELQKL